MYVYIYIYIYIYNTLILKGVPQETLSPPSRGGFPKKPSAPGGS